MPRPGIMRLSALALVMLAACGGGGGGGDDDGGSSTAQTTFTGNVAEAVAVGAGLTVEVEVCVENTTFCTFVDDFGFFTLAADVGGDVVLVFTGPDFVARVTLLDVPLGATVRLRNVRCSTITGTCEPEDVEIEGVATRGPIRCQQGPIDIVHVGELVIDGQGEDCIRTEGQCAVTIDADRIVLTNCETCVRTAGGSDVTLLVGPGGFQCDAGEDGIRAGGNSAVHIDVALGGNVDIQAGEVGLRSQGTALIEIGGDVCRVEGGEDAIRIDGNADVDTGACGAVDLIGGIDDDDDHGGDDDDEDEGDDDDHGGDDDHEGDDD